ncbi:4-alpha-glucanotransferase [Lachnobacterium bovis]|uniref:4-alpha-glucanotransferase n=1 Tax=Lachnobacterium bovis TaxID=140626 RepID=A0A1H9PXE6_9FIRM|nr:4-alpha-glucanotransferase [Lachnobacterium bovis]SER52852.1 4-alpha-glucanotransferase [Lachnobacterium bovis]
MRANGVLLAISSLPSKYGIGCFSKEAFDFIDKLKKAGQHYWQILPLGPTSYGDSPYQSFSTFAGNPYYIDLDEFIEYGWLKDEEVVSIDFGKDNRYVDYEKQYYNRYKLLKKAYQRSNISYDKEFLKYIEKEKEWLEDYALFMALKDAHNGKQWSLWEDNLRNRDVDAIEQAKIKYSDDIMFHKFLQFEFNRQWLKIKDYANSIGIEIIGDIPIYVSYDSSDAWANKELFCFDEKGYPIAVAGCPPDGFSKTGQLWGNPLYDWDYHNKDNYKWWIKRISKCFELYDVVRIDHFRGFDEYYTIPYGNKNAIDGKWVKGPNISLFNAIKKQFPNAKIIAEDLGYVTDSVRKLVEDTNFPGMKVLEFAFDKRDSSSESDYLPFNYPTNSVVYTGTHDNETIVGWFNESLDEDEKDIVRNYLGDYTTVDEKINIPLIRLAISSVSDTCIIPMQDILGYGNVARMNTPSTTGNNWKWRLLKNEFDSDIIKWLFNLTKIYGRVIVD